MGQQELYSDRFFDHDDDPFDEIARQKKKEKDRIRRILSLLLTSAIIGGGILWFMQNQNELRLRSGFSLPSPSAISSAP
ncbi:MAG: hypothetical protein P8J37_16195 [Fuerstiella sp.]|nr:hypothetical protein [Fuerstiella sp.]